MAFGPSRQPENTAVRASPAENGGATLGPGKRLRGMALSLIACTEAGRRDERWREIARCPLSGRTIVPFRDGHG